MRPLDVGVIGAGTAGAAAALFLSRQGHKVTVYERVPDPKPVGAGILLQPTGQAVLRRLGLAEAVIARTAPVESLRCQTVRGRTVFTLRYDRAPGHHQGRGLHRGVLFEALYGAVRRASLTLVSGVEVVDLADAKEGGQWFLTSDGGKRGPHELCVVADGARSQLRDDTAIAKRVRPHGWGALWFVGEDRDKVFKPELHQVVDGTRRMVGTLPTGLGPTGDRSLVSFFYSVRADRVEAWRGRGVDAWKAELRAMNPALEPLLAQVEDLDRVIFSRYVDVKMFPWNTDRVVYLGDAAHAMSPQLGQGANLALWDAMVLADAVAAHPHVDDALAAYSAARRRHLGYYQFATRALTPFFQGDSRALGWLRDLTFPTSRWLGFLRRRMVRTMAGIDRGIVRRPIPLAEVKALLPPPPSPGPAPAPAR